MAQKSKQQYGIELTAKLNNVGIDVCELETELTNAGHLTHLIMQLQKKDKGVHLSFLPSEGYIQKLITVAEEVDCYVMPIMEDSITADAEQTCSYVYFVSREYLRRLIKRTADFKNLEVMRYWLTQDNLDIVSAQKILLNFMKDVTASIALMQSVNDKNLSDDDVNRYDAITESVFDDLIISIDAIDDELTCFPELGGIDFIDFIDE